jgi:DNA invertase Pin-like site-specific DNA recombinase
MTKVYAYIRKSTKDRNQKYSLESQTKAITNFCKNNELEIVEFFEDIESGTNTERKGLKQALYTCEKNKSPLVVLRTDRLSRVPSQMFGLLENPNLTIYIAELGIRADPIMIGQFILYSSFEIEMLKRRTKEGMKTALEKRRLIDPNYKFGNPQIEIAQAKGRKAIQKRANRKAEEYITLLSSLYEQTGSYNATARELNNLGIKTQRNKIWRAQTVSNMLNRYKNNLGGTK